MALLGALAFVVALLVSVMLHEAGHFLTARRYGMKATQFFVGFGPTLFSRTRGETEYGIKAIPAGGFVKIVGMTQLEEVEPGDEDRAFYKQPAGRRAIVLGAGSFVHFCIAVLLVFGVTYAVGVVDEEAPVLAAPESCVLLAVPAAGKAAPECGDAGTVAAPGRAAGLQARDRVLSVAGTRTRTFEEVVAAIRANPGREVPVVVQRDGAERTLQVTPVAVQRPALDDPERTETVGAIGAGRSLVTKRLGPVASAKESVDRLQLIVQGTWTSLTEKLGTITKLYSDDRDAAGLVGAVGAARVSGEILGTDAVPFAVRVSDFLLLMAGLNLFVGVFNLLPLLPLDGGHLAVLGFEQARDRVKRVFGYQGALQRVDLTKLLPLTYMVVLLFVGLTLFIAGADIVNPISLNS
ncbi:MAG: peptidase [Frankiales bacterium]|nr:peptidase [Frankiales bacterium]